MNVLGIIGVYNFRPYSEQLQTTQASLLPFYYVMGYSFIVKYLFKNTYREVDDDISTTIKTFDNIVSETPCGYHILKVIYAVICTT